MADYLDAKRILNGLLGTTIPTPGQSLDNAVLGVKGASVIVGTATSPGGQGVAIAKVQQGLDLLETTGEVRITPETFGNYRRSSFIGAVLAALPGTEVLDGPTRVRLMASAPLHDQLIRACELAAGTRTTPITTAADPLQQLMVHELPATLRGMLDNDSVYKTAGSAGQQNFAWAETPWVSVFDRRVTETAQQGHYLTFLVRPDGGGVMLTLMQAVAGGGGLARLRAQAQHFRSLLQAGEADGLLAGPIELADAEPPPTARTQGYEAGTILARWLPAEGMPHDAMLAAELRRFLSLYKTTTERIDKEDAATNFDLPDEARTGTEAKRYRWHLRAEGRNRSIANNAKKYKHWTCEVCERDFVKEYGEDGKRCIDAHHLEPFHALDEGPKQLDPKTDFAVVCANCHRLLHSETPPLLPSKLAAAIHAAGTP